jgi:hypothetical protein
LAVDIAREPLSDVAARQRIAEKHYRWDYHLRALLDEWAGRDSISDYQNLLSEEPLRIAELRLLVLDLAIQAYFLDHTRLPDTLDELTPNYLPSLPIDNCSGKPFTYRRRGDRYTLYSLGPDGDDDHGTNPTTRWLTPDVDGDLVTIGPHGPSLWMRIRDGALERFKSLWKPSDNSAEPATK